MKLTVLIENSAPKTLCAEHGLSIHVDYNGHSVLLDGGASGRFAENAQQLGIDLGGVELCVLSHGHFDHGDGLVAFFESNNVASVYARPNALAPQYVPIGPLKKYIGLSKAAAAGVTLRLKPVERVQELLPGLFLVPDGIAHEQSLVAQGADGLVVMNSCCHAGAGHIIQEVLTHFPGQRVQALVGGFHLMGMAGVATMGVSPGIVQNLGTWLFDELNVGAVYTGHCTGTPAYNLLRKANPTKVFPLTTGLVLEF